MTVEERMDELGLTNVKLFKNPDYTSALIGITHYGQAMYDYELMLDYLADTSGMTTEEAAEFIAYNTIRALPYFGELPPMIVYSCDAGE